MAVENNNRIIYIDPNDVYNITGRNGEDIQMTPPYEDFCIAFNLLVTNYDRFGDNSNKIAGKDSNDVEYQLSWVCGNSQAAFLKGDTFGIDNGDSYLTTYYTEIHAGNYGTKKIVEGLGVEKIEVKFESWYTPTVNIKFVDVRGSSIFGNEEAIHTNGELTADNIFGCFFQIPYPLFKLQMKGFLGRPVTYQLTCSGCSHEYNASTGNFESNVTFIGYSYSLLTDIPFDYLVAAPKCAYVGAQYWESHVNSSAWALHDGHPPVKIEDFLNDIKSANTDGFTEHPLTEAEQDTLVMISGKRDLLTTIKENLSKFIDAFSDFADYRILAGEEDSGKRQLFLFFNRGRKVSDMSDDEIEIRVSAVVINAFNTLKASVQKYAETYSADNINASKLPNGLSTMPQTITAVRTLVIDRTDNIVNSMSFVALNGQWKTRDSIAAIKFNDDRTVLKSMANALNTKTEPGSFDDNLKEFGYVVDLSDLETVATNLMDSLAKDENNITRRVSLEAEKDIFKIVKCVPYIGNVFKILLCHLETFLHIIFEANDTIKTQTAAGQRTPDYLGVDINKTDIPKNRADYIPSWPGIVNHKVSEQQGSGGSDNTIDTLAWVGDFSAHRFEEEKVILALQAAVMNTKDNHYSTQQTASSSYLPICSVDFLDDSSPFDSAQDMLQLGVSAVGGLAAIRATLLLGIMCDDATANDFATLFGQMDAYNCLATMDVSMLRANIVENKGNGALNSILSGISVCDHDYDTFAHSESGSSIQSHYFETAMQIKDEYNQNKRHPMMKTDNTTHTYIHYYDKNGNGIVPTKLMRFSDYASQDIIKQDGNNLWFAQQFKSNEPDTSMQWAYLCNSENMRNTGGERNSYSNPYMFSVFTDTQFVHNIVEKYEILSNGSVDVRDFTYTNDFSKFCSTFLKVGNSDYSEWFTNALSVTPKRKKLGIKDENLLPSDNSGDAPETFDLSVIGIKAVNGSDYYNKKVVNFKSDGTYHTHTDGDATCDSNELTLPRFTTTCREDTGNLFGCPFYYMQNQISDRAVAKRVKALLFLHTFKYNHKKIANVFKNSKKNGCLEGIPYGALLLLGGLLWRSRYTKETNVDPIQYKEGTLRYAQANATVEYTLLSANADRSLVIIKDSTSLTTPYTISVPSLFGASANESDTNKWWPDINIMNCLIDLFEDFVDNGTNSGVSFGTIMNTFELRHSGSEYTGLTLTDFIKEFDRNWWTDKNASSTFEWLTSVDSQITCDTNFFSAYKAIGTNQKDNNFILQLFTNEDNEVLKDCVTLYLKKVVIADLCHRRMGYGASEEGTEIKISSSTYNSYITAFANTLESIVNEERSGTVNVDDSGGNGLETVQKNRDEAIAMYYYIKSLWDRWLLPYSETRNDYEMYDVARYSKRFTFIDSFYRNTFSKLPINCDVFADIYYGLSENASLFTFMDSLVSRHHCIFFATPDYIGFEGDETSDIALMEDLFKAKSFVETFYNRKSKTKDPETDNKFVIIYTNKPSEIVDERSGFTKDNFDIWSGSNGTDEAPQIFKTKLLDENSNSMTRYGYNVPSFGVAMNRQYNHIFKSVKLNMQNPVVTEQSIRTLENVIEKGSSGARNVVFQGQDTYPIFSSYSYICEVTMIGNAQICPLMYFQLLNMPMWRGTYMIFNVTHTMTPGDMTTTFSGMKLSSRVMNWSGTFFTKKRDRTNTDSSSGYNGEEIYIDEGGYVSMQPDYTGREVALADHWSDDENRANGIVDSLLGVTMDNKLIDLYNRLFEEIELLPENKSVRTWNLMIVKALDSATFYHTQQENDHADGTAADFVVMTYDGNGNNPQKNNDTQIYLTKAMDMLYCLHKDEIKEVILEYDTMNSVTTSPHFPKDLHVSVGGSNTSSIRSLAATNSNPSAHVFYIATTDARLKMPTYGAVPAQEAKKDWWIKDAPQEFRAIAARSYMSHSNTADFTKEFINYYKKNYTSDDLNDHFGAYTKPSTTTPKAVSDRIREAVNMLLKEFTKNQAVGICANMMRETGGTLNPKSDNPNDKGQDSRGICQWRGSRQSSVMGLWNKHYGTNYRDIADFSLAQQAYGAVLEMITKGYEKDAGDAIKATTTATDAAYTCMTKYERCSSSLYSANNDLHAKYIRQIMEVMGWS